MRTRPVLALLVGLVGIVGIVALGGCKKTGSPGAKASAGPVAVPQAILATVALKNPGQSIDEMLALVGQFAPIPLTRQALLEALAEKSQLPREMVAAIDVAKPMHLVVMDEKQIKEPDPVVVVIPLRSRQAFQTALEQKMKRSGNDGELVRYGAKTPGMGPPDVRLRVTDSHVWVASGAKAHDAARAYIEANLLPEKPAHDLVMRVMVQNILKVQGDALDRTLARAVDDIRTRTGQAGGPADQQQVALKAIEPWIAALKSTREAQLTLDLSREQITLALRGRALPGGRLEQLIKRQQVAEPFGYKVLPASSWLVLADRGNPAAQTESRKLLEPMLGQLEALSEAVQQRHQLRRAVTAMLDQTTGDYSVAFHRPSSGTGLTLSWVGRVADATKARAAAADLALALGAWAQAALAKVGKEVPNLEVARRTLSHGKAQGEIFELHLPLPADKREQIERVVGLPLTFAVAFTGSHALLCLGKAAEAQLKLLVDGVEQGKVAASLEQSPAFERARQAGTGRVGLLYVSLVDLVRWFEGTGFAELETIAQTLKETKVTTAPSMDWGVDDKRGEMDFTLRLPASHFIAFKPILDELQRRGMDMLGGQRAGWRDL